MQPKFPKINAMRVCICCGRVVARRAIRSGTRVVAYMGKATVRHKCPHGRWCWSGMKVAGVAGYNGPTASCPDCFRRRRDAK